MTVMIIVAGGALLVGTASVLADLPAGLAADDEDELEPLADNVKPKST